MDGSEALALGLGIKANAEINIISALAGTDGIARRAPLLVHY